MTLLHGFESSAGYRDGYVSIGNFDGVHRGHQGMIRTLVARARANNAPAVVFTFDPHPITLLRPGLAPPSLSTPARKAELLQAGGVDFIIAYPTDHALLQLSPEQFFERIIVGELNARGLVEGPNFFFGHNRAGNVDTLQTLCDATGLSLDVVPPVRVGEEIVSSSIVRELIAAGRIEQAVEMLGHPYQIRGTVAAGAVRGRTIGFPTANLQGVATLLPADGVYAGVAHHAGNTYAAAINLGPNPTFSDGDRKLEVHLLDFSGDLYGRELAVDFLARVRDIRTFESAETLRMQLERDMETVRQLVNCGGNR